MIQQAERLSALGRAPREHGLRVPSGWRVVQPVQLPGEAPNALAFALLHPGHGIALVDLLPKITPQAEQRLRERLLASGFAGLYGGEPPPVLHLALHRHELADLPAAVEQAFRGRAVALLPGGDAWLDTAERILTGALEGEVRATVPAPPRRLWPALLVMALLPATAGVALWRLWPVVAPPPVATQRPAPLAPVTEGGTSSHAGALTDAAGRAAEVSPAAPVPPAPPALVLALPEPIPPPEAAPPAARPLARTIPAEERRCRALAMRIQLGEHPSDDDLRQLQGCR